MTPLPIPRRILPIGILLAACTLTALLLGGHTSQAKDSQPVSATSKAAMTISTAHPQRATLPLQMSANGSLAAWQEAIVGSESSGLRLKEVRVNVGDKVERDQVLAVFANETVLADIASAKAAVAEAAANATAARNDAERANKLQGTGALSAQQIAQYQTSQASSQARLDSAQAALSQQELRLQHTLVTAPDKGTISSRSATVGSVVPAGAELFRLIRRDRLEWRAEVTASEIGRIKTGTPVRLHAATGEELPGRVRMVAPTIDAQTRVGLVYVDLTGTDTHTSSGSGSGTGTGKSRSTSSLAGFKPGMFLRGEFLLGSSTGLTVPQEAVVARDGFHYVFSVGADQRITQHKVEVGRRQANQVEILAGLPADAEIAVEGAGFLNQGDLVRIAAQGNAP